MKVDRLLTPAFDDRLPQLGTSLGGDTLLLTRVGSAAGEASVELTSAPEDAFAVIIQLGSTPAHPFWQDGHRIDVPAGAPHSIAVIDLAAHASAHVDKQFDSLNFRVPRVALDRFADQAGCHQADKLHLAGAPFSSVDPLLGALSLPMVAAMEAANRNPLLADHLLLSLMAHVVSRFGDGRAEPARALSGLSPWQQRRAQAMLDPVDGTIPTPTLSAVAEACGVSVAHFSRAFKSSVGLAPWTWHQQRRVDMAQALLRDASLSLAHVAVAAGFADQSHFTRAFRKHAGASPGRWRRDRGIRQ